MKTSILLEGRMQIAGRKDEGRHRMSVIYQSGRTNMETILVYVMGLLSSRRIYLLTVHFRKLLIDHTTEYRMIANNELEEIETEFILSNI
jgi:hypothetical protein